MSWYVDTSVWLLAAGGEHPDREPCRAFLRRCAQTGDRLHAGVETVQEFLFHRMRRGPRQVAVAEARALRGSVILHPFDEPALDLALTLTESTHLRGRDAVHVAVARLAGFHQIVSLDTDFDGVHQLTRLHPDQTH